MSVFTLMRLVGGPAIRSGSSLSQKLLGATSSLVPRKNLMLSPVACKRVYTPQEEHEKVNEIHHWKNEHYVAIALLPTIPVALAFPHPALDTLLVGAMVLHTHWRLEGVVQDYIHYKLPAKILSWVVLLLSITAFGSLSYFNYTDVGFAKAVRMLYTQL